MFVVKDEIYIKALLGWGWGPSLIAVAVVVDAAFKGVNGVSGFL